MNDRTYKNAGVDLELAAKVKSAMSESIIATHNSQVLNTLGSFGSMFELKGFLENFSRNFLRNLAAKKSLKERKKSFGNQDRRIRKLAWVNIQRSNSNIQ